MRTVSKGGKTPAGITNEAEVAMGAVLSSRRSADPAEASVLVDLVLAVSDPVDSVAVSVEATVEKVGIEVRTNSKVPIICPR
jgi:hypothetical protein